MPPESAEGAPAGDITLKDGLLFAAISCVLTIAQCVEDERLTPSVEPQMQNRIWERFRCLVECTSRLCFLQRSRREGQPTCGTVVVEDRTVAMGRSVDMTARLFLPGRAVAVHFEIKLCRNFKESYLQDLSNRVAESHSYESMPPVAAGVHIWFQPFDDVTGRLARVDFVPNKNAGPLDPEIDVERDILPLIGISKQRIVSRSSVLIDRKAAQEITDAILRNYVSRGHYNRHCFMRHVDLKFSFMQDRVRGILNEVAACAGEDGGDGCAGVAINPHPIPSPEQTPRASPSPIRVMVMTAADDSPPSVDKKGATSGKRARGDRGWSDDCDGEDGWESVCGGKRGRVSEGALDPRKAGRAGGGNSNDTEDGDGGDAMFATPSKPLLRSDSGKASGRAKDGGSSTKPKVGGAQERPKGDKALEKSRDCKALEKPRDGRAPAVANDGRAPGKQNNGKAPAVANDGRALKKPNSGKAPAGQIGRDTGGTSARGGASVKSPPSSKTGKGEGDGDRMYEIEEFLGARGDRGSKYKKDTRQVLVKWVGYPDPEWCQLRMADLTPKAVDELYDKGLLWFILGSQPEINRREKKRKELEAQEEAHRRAAMLSPTIGGKGGGAGAVSAKATETAALKVSVGKKGGDDFGHDSDATVMEDDYRFGGTEDDAGGDSDATVMAGGYESGSMDDSVQHPRLVDIGVTAMVKTISDELRDVAIEFEATRKDIENFRSDTIRKTNEALATVESLGDDYRRKEAAFDAKIDALAAQHRVDLRKLRAQLEEEKDYDLGSQRAELRMERTGALERLRVELDGVKNRALEHLRRELCMERNHALKHQREELTRERDAALKHQREELTGERDAALKHQREELTGERDAALKHQREELTGERDAALRNMQARFDERFSAQLDVPRNKYLSASPGGLRWSPGHAADEVFKQQQTCGVGERSGSVASLLNPKDGPIASHPVPKERFDVHLKQVTPCSSSSGRTVEKPPFQRVKLKSTFIEPVNQCVQESSDAPLVMRPVATRATGAFSAVGKPRDGRGPPAPAPRPMVVRHPAPAVASKASAPAPTAVPVEGAHKLLAKPAGAVQKQGAKPPVVQRLPAKRAGAVQRLPAKPAGAVQKLLAKPPVVQKQSAKPAGAVQKQSAKPAAAVQKQGTKPLADAGVNDPMVWLLGGAPGGSMTFAQALLQGERPVPAAGRGGVVVSIADRPSETSESQETVVYGEGCAD